MENHEILWKYYGNTMEILWKDPAFMIRKIICITIMVMIIIMITLWKISITMRGNHGIL